MKPAARSIATGLITALLLTGCLSHASNAQPSAKGARTKAAAADASEARTPESEMRAIIEYYVADRGSLARSYPVSISPARAARFRKFYAEELERIQKLDFDSMSQDGKVDYLAAEKPSRIRTAAARHSGETARRDRAADSLWQGHHRSRRSAAADGNNRFRKGGSNAY